MRDGFCVASTTCVSGDDGVVARYAPRRVCERRARDAEGGGSIVSIAIAITRYDRIVSS
jgi:hypothetical protein